MENQPDNMSNVTMIQWTSTTIADNDKIAGELISLFPEARVFCLSGNLGAGKTTFVKSIANFLGVSTLVSSPTFGIIHEYPSPQGSIFHFDFYRIQSVEEAFHTGCEDYFYSGEYCFIEWWEKIPELIPDNAIYISLNIGDNDRRVIQIQKKS